MKGDVRGMNSLREVEGLRKSRVAKDVRDEEIKKKDVHVLSFVTEQMVDRKNILYRDVPLLYYLELTDSRNVLSHKTNPHEITDRTKGVVSTKSMSSISRYDELLQTRPRVSSAAWKTH
ncbi:hypothetical protein TNIN_336751 [Trichonephila inaurata madagascariensis]|uniref:Uncharacterized protein n=1 Tax=Trichonephila inaurata madagascariensis TaxID=2747483 RepID=A0A8X6XNA6_9ARAC|nr:hypothetical protein TNIN_336751 [Trichonephila inaurata madagascariensis]